jgi:hypothetical protein
MSAVIFGFLRVAVFGLYLLSGAAFAKALPLPDNLISLTTGVVFGLDVCGSFGWRKC